MVLPLQMCIFTNTSFWYAVYNVNILSKHLFNSLLKSCWACQYKQLIRRHPIFRLQFLINVIKHFWTNLENLILMNPFDIFSFLYNFVGWPYKMRDTQKNLFLHKNFYNAAQSCWYINFEKKLRKNINFQKKNFKNHLIENDH